MLEKIKAVGLKGKPQGRTHSWTDEQMEALKSAGGEISSRDFSRKWKLTEESVRWWARKFGIKFKQKRMWTDEMEEVLRGCVTVEAAMRVLNRSRRAVLCKAQSMGLTLQSPRSGRPRGSRMAGTQGPRVRAEKVVVKKRVKAPAGSAVVWCESCRSPVVNWEQHFNRMPGCRMANALCGK